MANKEQKDRREEARTKRIEARAERARTKAERDKAKVAGRKKKTEMKEAREKAKLEARRQGKPSHGFNIAAGVWRNKPKRKPKAKKPKRYGSPKNKHWWNK